MAATPRLRNMREFGIDMQGRKMSFENLGGLRAFALGVGVALVGLVGGVSATPYTENVPAPTSLPLPPEYPAAGGVAIVLTGANGNVYYQFSDPTGAFRGFQNNGQPAAFRGNPFTINDPIPLDCGFRSCTDYFGGSIARMDVRFSAYDGDTQPGGFDENDISLIMNGVNIGSWSGIQTEATNNSGTQSFGFNTGFGNGTFDTAWFSSTNQTLLNNVLATGQTTTQVLDDDPNDNYWDFRRGPRLPTNEVRTIAPGYEMTKTVNPTTQTDYFAVGDIITYDYTVTNIGSVLIEDVAVFDDKIGQITNCAPTTLPETESGQPESALARAICSATYEITQEDIDNGTLTNVANATGDPRFGTLGPLEAEVTLQGPTLNSSMTVLKEANPTSFSAEGEVITYTFTVTNTGNSTLSDVELVDPKIPNLTCEAASLAPPPAAVADTRLICTGTYTVTQDDVDEFAINGNQLENSATATATDPNGDAVQAMGSEAIDGPTAAPAMEVTKVADRTTFSTDGEVINYSIVISNTGNVTWPGPPDIEDLLTMDESCPAGPVAPGADVTCTATYAVDLDDLDAGEVPNRVDAEITVAGVTATGFDEALVTAVIETELAIVKTLQSGANPITADTDELVYAYELTNNGNTRLDTFAVTDDKVDVVCPAVTLDPGQSVTCTSVTDPYDVQQSDIDDGGVTNVASATAETPLGVVVESEEVELFVPADQNPALSMAKATDPDPFESGNFATGNPVKYIYTVTNTGNVTITDPVTVTDNKFPNPISCPAGDIIPGGFVECEATYILQPGDIAALTVTNTATATDGNVTSNSDTVTIPQTGAPGITLLKEALTADYDDTSDTITYRFTVTNSGSLPISEDPQVITFNDPLIGDFSCPVEQPAILAPTESFSCEQVYGPVSQQQIDDGEIVNIATASFVAGGDTITSPSSTATVPANVTPALTLVKTPSVAQFDTLNQTVTYSFAVTNDSTQTLSSVVVTDPLVPGFSCTITDLGAGDTDDTTCEVDYMVTQDDLDAGVIMNTANALGTSPTGATVSENAMANITIDPVAATYVLDLEKTSDVSEFDAVGDVITYALEVINDGNLTLENVLVVDPALGLNCVIGTLAPMASDDSCVGTHVITQPDLDAGFYFNEGTATADNATAVTDDITVNAVDRVASLEFTKTADGPFVAENDVVTFTLSVENTGDVTLTDVVIFDDFFDPDLTCNIASIPVNTTDSSCTGTYTITQADVDAGSITNTATVNADGVDGAPLPQVDATAVVQGPVADPSFDVTKVEQDNNSTYGAVGTTELFDFSVTNTGNVTLTGVTISDPTAFFSDEVTPFSCSIADLEPGDTATFCIDGTTPLTGYVPITQALVDAGGLNNTVTVTATPPSGSPFDETASVSLAGPAQDPELTLAKTAPTGADFTDVGDVITYQYVIMNTGNITLTAPITVADDKTTVVCPTDNPGPVNATSGRNELAVGGTLTCTATYAVTQDDLDLGSVTNLATASINQPVVPSALHPSGVADVDSNDDTATVNAMQMPAISIAKAIEPGTPSTFAAVNDPVSFQFTVTNTGNVTLENQIFVNDLSISPNPIACPASGAVDVPPGGEVVCTATWLADQPRIDAGSFTNSATAQTSFGAFPPVVTPTPATATATAIQTPAMELVKGLTSPQVVTFQSGQPVEYQFTITNTGNTTMEGPINVVDTKITTSPFECSPNDLAPTDPPLVCTATYIFTADDVSLGSVTNVAYAVDDTGVQSTPSSVTVPGLADPSMEITKVADVATFDAVGDQIEYTYEVTNNSPGSMVGGVLVRPSFEEDIFINDDKFPNPIACNPINNGASAASPFNDDILSPDETTECTAIYTVTQADLDAVQADGAGGLESAFVTNTASGTTDFGSLVVTSPPASVTVPGAPDPSLAVSKDVTTGNDPAAAGDELTYTIITENDGNQTMSNVVVTDPMLGALTCTIDGAAATAPFTLNAPQPVPPANPGTTVECTGTYTVTQDDVDAQMLMNTATAEGSSPDGTVVTETGEDMHPLVDDMPAVEIVKSLSDGEPGSAFTTVGEPVEFTMTVTNIGNVTLSTIDVTDSLVTGQTCTIGPLAPTAPNNSDATCTFTYVITQDDINNGGFINTGRAEATADTPDATEVFDEDTLEAEGPEFEPALTVDKTANVAEFDSDTDEITYTYVIANTGNVTITDQPVLTDDKFPNPITCPAIPTAGLLPLEFITCTAVYDVQQEDVDNGGVTNIATVTAPNSYVPGGEPLVDVAELTVPSVRAPSFMVTKVADVTADVAVGDTITYRYTVENTGNVTLEPVVLVDAHTSDAGVTNLTIENGGVIASLAPDEDVILEGTYVVTQGDIDAGVALTNTVTATATPPTGTTVDPETADETVTVQAAEPELDVVKTVDPASGTMLGEEVIYNITVENTGNVTLFDVTLDDSLERFDGAAITPDPVPTGPSADIGIAGALDVDEVWTYEVRHTITQDDLDAGGLSNQVVASGEDELGNPAEDTSGTGTGTDDVTPYTLPSDPMVVGLKTITSDTVLVDETVVFEITVENTGNVTLNSVAVASDTLTRADGTPLVLTSGPDFVSASLGSAEGALLVDEIATYRATYVLQQEDIDAGGIENTATVTGTPPNGAPVTDVTDDDSPTGDDPTVLVIEAEPEMSMVKTLASGGPTFETLNQELVFEFEVTNEGNVTLTDPISITDEMITDAGEQITCDPVPLAPGDSLTCSGSYFVTQDDLDAGSIMNVASATDGTTTSPEDDVEVTGVQNPSLATVKEANPMPTSAEFFTGAVVNYLYTVTNDGNVTITDDITINDNKIAPGDLSCDPLPAGGLLPTESIECEGTYTVTADDVLLTSVTNNASAVAGDIESPVVSETIPANGTPALTIIKDLTAVNGDAGLTDFSAVGDVLTYTFTVQNTGQVTFGNDIFVNDPMIEEDPLLCFTATAAFPDVTPATGPRPEVTCEGTYIVTQDDLDAGEVVNEATASTEFGNIPTTVTSPADTETTPAATNPAISILKEVATLPVTDVEQVLTYTLTVTNEGNQTLSDVVVVDELLPDLVCEVDELAVDGELICSADYEVTQDDVDAGTLVNDASVTALTPQGGEVDDETSLTTDMPAAEPAFELVKSAMPDPFGDVDSGVTYTFSVENTGNVTLFDVTITDEIVDPPFTCTIAELAVDATDTTCTLAYTVTQNDVDAGEITNLASATATDPFDTEIDGEDEITTDGPDPMPSLAAVKTASFGGAFVGSVTTYTLTVENTGNVTLTAPNVVDTMTRLNTPPSPTGLDAPFAYVMGDDDNDGFLGVDEIWTYTAEYTLGQADINAGGIQNSVEVTADDPNGTEVSDTSDDGDPTDGNTEDDPTVIEIEPGPAIGTEKTVDTAGSEVDDTVVFLITATNLGNVTLDTPTIDDTLVRADGSAPIGAVVGPTLTSGNAAGIDPGEVWVWRYEYTLTQEDIDAGGLRNTATAGGSDPNDEIVTDVSDNGDDTDGNQDDDPTEMLIEPTPSLFAIKTVVSTGDAVGETVVFDVVVTNNGNVTLSNLSIVDEMTNAAGDTLATPAVSVIDGSAASLPVDETMTFRVTYTLTQDDIDSGSVTNTATVTGEPPLGPPVSDVSDSADETGKTPTVAPIAQVDSMEATKEAGIPTRIAPDVFELTFDMTVTNTGNVTQTGLVIEDDLAPFLVPATLVGVDTPVISGFETGMANGDYDGLVDVALVSPDTSLAPGETGTMSVTLRYNVAAGFPTGTNTVTITSDRISTAVEATAGVPASADPDILAVKSVTPDRAQVGEIVTYTLTFQNRLATAEANLTLVDALPAGLAYVPDSATYNGGATPAPELIGRTLQWADVTLAPNETVELTLQARITQSGLGDLTNEAYVLDPSGARVSNIATATVRIPVEAVFDCADIIGKVFDDRNMNGYQDGLIDDGAITDQTYDGGKFGSAPVIEEGGEPGIPNVRLSTVTGTIITTDEYGRFSVPCAELPADIGSNFTLKLDDRSLPSGYQITTENPRVIRVTPGTMARLNFGATIATVVDIDLMDSAFQPGSAQPTAALARGVDQLVAVLEERPSVLRLTYYRAGESRELARQRLDILEQMVRDKWRGNGGWRLPIERAINRLQ